jgi:hypothetical protein
VTGFRNLPKMLLRWDSGLAMTHFPQPHPTRRAPRVRVNGSIQALVMLEDGQRTKAKLQSVSTTGGMLRLARALADGDFVEVAFPTQTGSVRGMAEMLKALPATEGALQPFRFIAMGDDEHRALRMMVDSASDQSFLGLRSNAWSSKRV